MDNIIVGDTLEQTYTFDNYSATEYDLWVALRGSSVIDLKNGETGVTITTSGESWIVSVTATETATWTIGDYWYQIYVGQSSFATRYTVEEGTVELEQSFSDVTGTIDNRSYVKKTLDAIQAVIQNRASKSQEKYSIAGRTLDRTPIADLLNLENEFRKRYIQEQQQEKINNGESPGNLIKVTL
jgi:hypothetical protein